MSETHELHGTALNAAVARKLGWRAVDLNDNPSGLRVKGPNWVISEVIGNTSYPRGRGFSEQDAWDDVPDFQGDLNAAWTYVLPKIVAATDLETKFELRHRMGKSYMWLWWLIYGKEWKGDAHESDDLSPRAVAELLCRAFVAG